MGIPYGINNTIGKIQTRDSIKILNYAFNHGIRYLDSAESYGNAHEIIGLFHKENPQKKFKIITKLPHSLETNIHVKVDSYLKEMNVTEIDTLMFHSYHSYNDYGNSNKKYINDLRLSGKIKSFGVSVYTNKEIEKVIQDKNVDIIQFPFNLLDNKNLREGVMKKVKSSGKMIHTRSAYLQGLFFKDQESEDLIIKKLSSELSFLKDLSKEFQIPINKLALNYCLQQPLIDNVIIGVDSVRQLKENIQTSYEQLSERILEKIDEIKITNQDLINPSLWN